MKSNMLKRERKRLGLTQAALAQILDIDVITVSRWERGLHPIPQAVALLVKQMQPKATRRSRVQRRTP